MKKLGQKTLRSFKGHRRICTPTFSLIIAIFGLSISPGVLQATDVELEERLKAIMILFKKNEIGLQEEIRSLELQIKSLKERNQQLEQQLAFEKSKNRNDDTASSDSSTDQKLPLIDVNSAAKDSLMTLPLVNGYIADRIISGRPWKRVEDLIQIQGFSTTRLKRVENLVEAVPIREITEVAASENPVD